MGSSGFYMIVLLLNMWLIKTKVFVQVRPFVYFLLKFLIATYFYYYFFFLSCHFWVKFFLKIEQTTYCLFFDYDIFSRKNSSISKFSVPIINCSETGKQFFELDYFLFRFCIFSLPFKKPSGLWLTFFESYGLLNTLHYFTQIKEELSWQFFIDYKDLYLYILFFFNFLFTLAKFYITLMMLQIVILQIVIQI